MNRPLLLLLLAIANPASANDTSTFDAFAHAAPTCDPALPHCVEIRLHVAHTDTGPVVTPEWMANQLVVANRHFAPIDVSFQIASVDELSTAHLRNRKERSALAKHLGKQVIDVFVTGALEDIHIVGEQRYGVAWTVKGRKYVIVSATARNITLAHEIGHFFGLPHSTYPISIMNKTKRTEPPPAERRFSDEEFAKMKPFMVALFKTKRLRNVKRRRR